MHVGLIDPASSKYVEDVVPPVGLACLSARLKQDGHTGEILDVALSSEGEIAAFLGKDFDLIGLSATSATFSDALGFVSHIKNRTPSTPIVVGGPHTSIAGADILRPNGIDFIVCGEGEETLSELAQHLASGNRAYGTILGLGYRDRGGNVRLNEARPGNERLDEWPYPSYDSLDMSRYTCHVIASSRGCPYGCTFCAVQHIWGRKIRLRSPESLVGEVRHLFTTYGKKDVMLCDDVFNVDIGRACRFCQLLIDSGLDARWHCWSFRADRADPELLDLMKRSGCETVSVGVESANPQVLKNIKKHETIEQIEQGIRNILRSGVKCLTLNMIGNAGDTLESVRETMRFNRRLRVDGAKFFMALPYPKTELWDYVAAHGRFLHGDYTCFHHFSGEPVFETDEFPSRDRREAYRLARRFSSEVEVRAHFRRAVRRVVKGDFLHMSPKRVGSSMLRAARLVRRSLLPGS
jgi:anaerobic magnesium-protoporphyrin IX monomethyl ester cyclase